MKKIRILGIDPGTSRIGYGIIDYNSKGYEAIDYGTIDTPANIENSARILTINKKIIDLIDNFKPDFVGVEELFYFKNAKTVIKVAEVRGAIILTIRQKNINFMEFTPLQVKQAVTGYGRAEKLQIQEMTKIILKLDTIPKPDDAADALAIAICCANSLS